MTLSPIPKVLSTFLKHKVKALLIGGQACILYGAAEFSRDIDLAIMVSPENLEELRKTLEELDAERVFYPVLSEEVLLRGHACHFRYPQSRSWERFCQLCRIRIFQFYRSRLIFHTVF